MLLSNTFLRTHLSKNLNFTEKMADGVAYAEEAKKDLQGFVFLNFLSLQK